jgi:hypothetical protein
MSNQEAKFCTQIKASGHACTARAMMNSEFCFFHDPEKVQERAAARKAGGITRARRAVVLPPHTPNFELGTVEQMDGFVCSMMNHILRGELDPKVAATVGYLLQIQLKIKELQQGVPFLPAPPALRTERKRVQSKPQPTVSRPPGGPGSDNGNDTQTQDGDGCSHSVSNIPENNE